MHQNVYRLPHLRQKYIKAKFPINCHTAWWLRGSGDVHWPQNLGLPQNSTTRTKQVWILYWLKYLRAGVFLVVVAFSSCARIFGRMFNNSFTACAFFFLFFLKWRLACTHLFHSLGQDQSTVAQRAELTVTEWVYACLGNLPPALLAE